MGIVAATIGVVLLVVSVHRRFRQRVELMEDAGREGWEARGSPLADAVKELVGVAGGIYLGLLMVVSFVKLKVPGTVPLWGVDLDPLALIALASAIVQPFVLPSFRRGRR